MSALGHKQTFAVQNGMSALPLKADIGSAQVHVRFVPIADIALKKERPPRGGLSFKGLSRTDQTACLNASCAA